MDNIRKQLSTPLGAGVVGLIVGLILGLFFAWQVWPAEYEGAQLEHLVTPAKVEYLRTAMEAYGFNGNAELARQRYTALGTDADEVLSAIVQSPGNLPPEVVQAFASAVVAGGAPAVQPTPGAAEPGTTPAPAEPTPGEAAPPAEGGAGNILRTLLLLVCGIAALAVVVFFVIFILRGRRGPSGPMTPAQQAQQARREAVYTDYATSGAEPPMAQFMASYKLGDDLFDDSFSIDSPSGEFMGECGVGISETIGVGDPKKVTAFEVWVFDKNDIQTVTKVLMSAHAFSDDVTRQRLAAKGEPVRVAPGSEAVLETQTLQLVARVVDMGYGEGALPPESFFDRFILELAVWPKS